MYIVCYVFFKSVCIIYIVMGIIICMCLIMCMYVCMYVYVCVSVACYSNTNSFGEIRTRYRKFRFVPVWTRSTGDSKTDAWDDPEIRTDSCSEDQMAIRIQNCIISCECLFIDLFQF